MSWKTIWGGASLGRGRHSITIHPTMIKDLLGHGDLAIVSNFLGQNPTSGPTPPRLGRHCADQLNLEGSIA